MPLVLTPRSIVGAPPLSGAVRRESGTIVIGRATGSDFVLTHPLASGRHCTITGQGVGWQLHDTSTNGTSLNGERITAPRTLRHGDMIGVADLEFSVAIGESVAAAGSTAMKLDDWGRAPTQSTSRQPTAASSGGAAAPLLDAAGLPRGAVQTADPQVLAAAGELLKASVAGLMAMIMACRKAREDLRVAPDADSANPLLSASSPDDALLRLLALPPATAGTMIAEAVAALEVHRRATLGAMQATFKASLDQFAPAAIKQRARDDAAAWKTYEKAFGAHDGFVEVFARELARSYGEIVKR